MRKVAVLFALVFLASHAFAEHLIGVIDAVEPEQVERDEIILGCEDGHANDCNPTMWYYLTTGDDCSINKSDYVKPVTDTDGGEVLVQEILKCEAEGAKHLCLWVEKNGDPSHHAVGKSAQLNVYCAPECTITKPTSQEPFRGGFNGSTEVNFNVTLEEQNLESYTMQVVNSDNGDSLCRFVNNSPEGNIFTEVCTWSDAKPGEYDVEVLATDEFGLESSCNESGAIKVEGNSPPHIFDFRVVLFGFNEPTDNAFNLKDMFYDPNDDELEVELGNVSDCTRIVDGVKMIEDVTKDQEDYIDIGKVNVNPLENTEYSCNAEVSARETSTPEHYSVAGSFQIIIRRAGEMSVLVKRKEDEEFVEADVLEDALVIESSPGQDVELDVKVVNKLSGLLTEPIDIYFVLDASGTFRTELLAVKSSIELINTNLKSLYRYAECMPTCVRYGVVIFGGMWEDEPNMTDRGDRWVSNARTRLGTFEEVRDIIDKVKPSAPWKEPWFEYLYYSILDEDESIGWRVDAKKMVVLITDAPSNGDHPPIIWHNGTPNKYIDPFPRGLFDVEGAAKEKEVIISAIYPDNADFCEKRIWYNNGWICPGSWQEEELCKQTGGICIPYQVDNDFQPVFGKLNEEISKLLERDSDDFELGLRLDLYPDPGYDYGWFNESNLLLIEKVSRDPLSEPPIVNWKFHVPTQGEPGYEEGISQKTFGYFGEPLLMDINNSFFFRIKFAGAQTRAVIGIQGNRVEGQNISFNGTDSTCSDDLMPQSYQWTLEDKDGNPITEGFINPRRSIASKKFGDNMDGLKIKLEITCSDGTDLSEQDFSIANVAPQPSITPLYEIRVSPGTQVSLFAESDDPGEKEELKYRWKFGDDLWTDWSESTQAQHLWNILGTYKVLLEVQDKDLDTGRTEKNIYVTDLLDVYILEMKTTDEPCDVANPANFDLLEEKNIFSLDDTINACFRVTNNTNNDLYEVNLDAAFLEAYSREELQWFTPEKFGLSANQSRLFSWKIQNNAAGSFLLEALVEKHEEENLVQNNFADGFVTVTNSLRNPVAVPETNPIMIVLVALAVIFLAGRKKNL